jgi:hypothetical protein
MPKFELPGVGEIQTQGEGLSTLEFDAIKQIIDNRATTSGVAMEEDTQIFNRSKYRLLQYSRSRY